MKRVPSAEPSRSTNLYGLSRPRLEAALAPLGLEPFRSRQLFAQIYRRDSLDPARWTDISAPTRDAIAQRFRIERPRVASAVPAEDGTVKFALDLPDGGQVEAVAIPARERMTFCISSQVGCAYGCKFCMTAKLGFVRHLNSGEIVGQVAALLEATETPHGQHNIVFMGMGEPLHNADNVIAAISILTDKLGLGLGPRRITVSTVGLPKGIEQLAASTPAPRLAVSLVAADQTVRASLMPVAKSVGLDELAEAVRAFGAGKRDQPTFEVVMLDGVNDAPELAVKLVRLARRASAKVNLIEFNPTPQLPYRPSSEARMNLFMRTLRDAGVIGTVRRSRGKDAFAACGQLAFLQKTNAVSERS